jgi:hypothetical protein
MTIKQYNTLRNATFLVLVACILLAWMSRADEPIAELLTVRGSTIYPSNVVATIESVAQSVAAAASAAAQAEAASQAAATVSNAVAGINEIVNSLEGIGYIRGYVLQFGSGIAADTNLTASIVQFESAGNNATNSLWDIWTYYTQDPGTMPIVRYSESVGRTNLWDAATPVGTPAIEEITVDGTVYEAYRHRLAMPLSYTSAFFRTFADVSGVGTNTIYLPVRNGIAVNGETPLTATFTVGTNAMRFVGGVRVQ